MVRRIGFLVGLAAVLSYPEAGSGQRAVFLVRHAERAANPGDPGLTPAGEERAAALADLLQDAGITAIFTSDARRTQETAKPLADALGSMRSRFPAATFQRIRSEHADDVVLVVGHSNTIPDLVKQWQPSFTREIDDSEFDKIFVVIPGDDGAAGTAGLRYGSPSMPGRPLDPTREVDRAPRAWIAPPTAEIRSPGASPPAGRVSERVR